ncbi:Universal stress protein [Burkholderiaceae bacterium]|nr:Universal stress protein [Burkholderiaceae bacterium]
MKILMGVDGSEYTKRMLDFVAAHEDWLGSGNSWTVLHCVPAIPHRAAAFLGTDQVRAFYEADAEAVFKPIREFFKTHPAKPTFVYRIGPAGTHIAKIAERSKHDLIILGTHGHGAVGGLVMGSVTTRVVSLVRTPVLLVR